MSKVLVDFQICGGIEDSFIPQAHPGRRPPFPHATKPKKKPTKKERLRMKKQRQKAARKPRRTFTPEEKYNFVVSYENAEIQQNGKKIMEYPISASVTRGKCISTNTIKVPCVQNMCF